MPARTVQLATRDDLRNVAIVAHVDHGKTTLVDASEGPLPQTRFVLRKTLEAGLPVILVINKVDRPDARIAEVVDACYELFIDLDATEEQIEFPIVYASARAGLASLNRPADGELPDSENLEPLFDVLRETVPPPCYEPGAPLQAHVTNLDASAYLGRIALCRIRNGTISRGQQAAWCRRDGTIERVKISELYLTEALDRVQADSAGPGDIVAIAGIPDIMIGETLADVDAPRPLPLITVDEPAISMTIGVNTSPLAGLTAAAKVTARLVRDRLDRELVGKLSLAVLVETMRREGYELTVGRPAAVTREVDGAVYEPVERLSVDVPEEYLGTVTSLISVRRGRMESMTNHGTGWVRLEFVVPARGLIGFRTQFLTETRGTGIAHHVFEGYEPWQGAMRGRATGSLVADRSGSATPYAMFNLQERGSLFVPPGTEVYEGMIVGENSRPDDMDVNITRERKVTNVRQSTGEELERLVPPRLLSLEQALEFCADDECVEVTGPAVRLRKTILDAKERGRARARASRGS